METYTLNVVGLTRELPVCPINDKVSIAGFVMFSDVEMTVRSAEELLKKVPEFDLIVTAESKGIPLAYEMAKQANSTYIVARKKVKLYMTNPISTEVQSITTGGKQTLYLSDSDVEKIKGKRILIVDDVISTGESLIALEKLVNTAGGIICAKAAVLAEGMAAERSDIIFLEKLPLITKE